MREHFSDQQAGEPLPSHVDLNLSMTSWQFIMQDIVRQLPTLDYLSAVSSCAYSGRRPDDFGGAAVVISANEIIGKSMNDLVEEYIAQVSS